MFKPIEKLMVWQPQGFEFNREEATRIMDALNTILNANTRYKSAWQAQPPHEEKGFEYARMHWSDK